MKQWIVKLINQLDIDLLPQISEDKATLLYIIDTYNKHLFEIENHSVRRVREKLDKMSKALISTDKKELENTLFEIRQFFSSYRIDEYTYIQNTFDDFKRIVWDFADQLSEDMEFENSKEKGIADNLKNLKEAVESNSLDQLRLKSREFINSYVDYQNQKNEIRVKRMSSVKKNLHTMKRQLLEANNSLNFDHLTSAHNRKSFEDYVKKLVQMNKISTGQYSLIVLDIDFFKKINDSYGHDIGDFVLKECVGLLREVFDREDEMIARIGGEEFAIVLPNTSIEHCVVRAEQALSRVRNEVFIQGDLKIQFTVSMGVAQLLEKEGPSEWLKRADLALYQSKNTGRNKHTIASTLLKTARVA